MSVTHARRRRITMIVLSVIAGIIALTVLAFVVSPWPGALVIRAVFQSNAAKVLTIMTEFAPTSGVDEKLNVAYQEGNAFSVMDVYYPTGTSQNLGTIVWTHGGAWVSGSKDNDRPYFQILASHGYTVIGMNYTYGPEATYPFAVGQLNDGLAFITAHANELHVDATRIILAGDSAGAQLTSQLALLTTSPTYARELGITPALTPDNLRGVILNCGIYRMSAMLGGKGILAWGDDTSLWAYTGDRNLADSPAMAQMSTYDFVTPDFPDTYISGGNADPLTDLQSKPLAARLTSLGVDVSPLFWPADQTPPLPHEYQFRLDLASAQTALTQTLKFIEQRLGPGVTSTTP
ncbi:MAG: alpha/beta hydrolase [Microbacteriaceae bacterium]|nr:alpha/beta hydrolase [Microbacteriaceae bacterium]